MAPRHVKLDKSGKVTYSIPSMTKEVSKLRMDLGLTQKELGKELYVSEKTVRNIESGRHKPIGILQRRVNEWLQEGKEARRMAEESL